jgi:hypothetical protein
MENTNPSNTPAPHLKYLPSHKSCLTSTPSHKSDLILHRRQKSINRSVSFAALAEEATAQSNIGDDYSDPPSILFIESEPEEDKQTPKNSFKTPSNEVEGVIECRATGVSKSTGSGHISKVLRILSNQLTIQKNNYIRSSIKRSYSMTFQKIDIDSLLKSLSVPGDYLCTLFGSMCIIKGIDPIARNLMPANILSLKRPQGLLCTLYYNSIANKTLVLDLDETLIHQDSKGKIIISVLLDQGVYTEVILMCEY